MKPTARTELLEVIHARFERQRLNEEKLKQELAKVSFQPDFSSFAPLVEKLGLTDREAETLLWVVQDKSNAGIATILGNSEETVKKIMGHIFESPGSKAAPRRHCVRSKFLALRRWVVEPPAKPGWLLRAFRRQPRW